MPVNYKNYPPDWHKISHRIRDRAGNRCEQCGAPNGVEIVRSTADPARYIVYNADEGAYTWPDGRWIRMSEIPEEFCANSHVKVILTVHHKGAPKPDGSPGDPHDKFDCRPENLIALCQRCHLLADLPLHMENRKRTLQQKREEKRRANGQMEMFHE